MQVQEIKVDSLDTKSFIEEKTGEIAGIVGDGSAFNALSGGVDSSAVTMLGHKALGDRLKTLFVDNGIMRHGEPQRVVSQIMKICVDVVVVVSKEKIF